MVCPQGPVIKNTNIKSAIYLTLCWIPCTSPIVTGHFSSMSFPRRRESSKVQLFLKALLKKTI